MSPTRLPKLGSVVWAEVADAKGFSKVRPAVVVSATKDIVGGKPVRLAAITTRLPVSLPKDHVLLPWNPQGKARSGLRRKCAAVATWLVEVPVSNIQEVVGILPPGVIAELLAKVAAFPPTVSPSEESG